MTTARRLQLCAVIAALALLITACEQIADPLYNPAKPQKLALWYVSRDAKDIYNVTNPSGKLRIDASRSNKGSQSRAVIWPSGTKMTTNHQSCATWSEATGEWPQEGLALRARTDGKRFRTIVVAKNLWFGAVWQMNVYTWDSTRSPYFKIHGAVALPVPFLDGKQGRPLPWNVCARVEGSVVRIKGWNSKEKEPSWTDKDHSGIIKLPAEWVYPGKAGWYGGHIDPGRTIAMVNPRTTANSAN